MAQVHYAGAPRNVSAEIGRWSLRGLLEWREWDSEVVVRADHLAATHLLTGLAGKTFRVLLEGAQYPDEIAAKVFKKSAPPSAATAALLATFSDPGDNAQELLAVLTEFETLGLARVELA